MIGFVYRWECIDGRWYIGSHLGSVNDGYISSSTVLNNEDLTKWERTILAQGPISEMRDLETVLLAELNAITDPLCINQANGGGSPIVFKEIKHKNINTNRSEEVKHLLTLIGEI